MKKWFGIFVFVGILCCSCSASSTEELQQNAELLLGLEPQFELEHGYCILQEDKKEAFIDAYMEPGASEMGAVYCYYDEDDSLQMELYYDFTANHGCGIRYYYDEDYVEMKGFVLGECRSEAFQKEDADTIRTIDFIAATDSWIQVKDFDEVYQYDEAGRVQSYEAYGTAYNDAEGVYDEEIRWLTTTEFEYWENGSVKKKDYARNMSIWGQIGQEYSQYFDDEERLIYDIGYASPGYYENYYIYEADSSVPAVRIGCDKTQMVNLPEIYIYSEE
ncbi:MAG: hypothetical protein NC089_12355 [Bacteroides sp.]|nr:hypothetical protein [Bacteroides sp.]MCM1550270.1 hypothetical protein [Clostridium sp.]